MLLRAVEAAPSFASDDADDGLSAAAGLHDRAWYASSGTCECAMCAGLTTGAAPHRARDGRSEMMRAQGQLGVGGGKRRGTSPGRSGVRERKVVEPRKPGKTAQDEFQALAASADAVALELMQEEGAGDAAGDKGKERNGKASGRKKAKRK